jgi:hypothetical protein
MKKLFIITMFLFACMFSNGQAVRSSEVSVNVMSYPTLLLEHQNYNLKIEGLGAVEEYGVAFENIEKLFRKTQKMVYTSEDNFDYTLKIFFETPSIKNEGIKKEESFGRISFTINASCIVPVSTSLVNKDGAEIIERHFVYQSGKINTDSYATEAEANKGWSDFMKNNRNKEITNQVNQAIGAALFDFQTKHDLYTYAKKFDFYRIKIGKKFPEEGWEKNAQKLDDIILKMIPGQTLNDYRDSIIPMIKFYDDQYELFVLNDEKGLMKSSALINGSNLCLLLTDFDKLPKYHELLKEWRLLNYFGRDQNKYVEEYTKRYENYKIGHTIDAEMIELAKKRHIVDSIATKPSNVKVYLKNNNIFEGQAYVNVYRPNTVVNNGNIIDLSFGQVLEFVGIGTEKVIGRFIASEVKKVVAGEEIYYPAIFGSNDNPRFTYLIFESPKIRVTAFKSAILFQKSGDVNAEDFTPTLFGNMYKKLSKYFVDSPEFSQKISDKEFKIETRNDVIEIAKKYSELK